MNIVKTSIQRPVTVSMFVLATVLFGFVSLDRLAVNLLPDISYPSLTIQTDYPDAAPEEVEQLITRPIEEAVGVVPGLTRLFSVSRPGQSEVVLEFSWDTSMDLATLEVREKLDLVRLPRDVRTPVLLRFDPSHDPILRLRILADRDLRRLRHLAEKELKKELESVDGVAAVRVSGGLEEQIQVEIDEKRLSELGIPITEVTQVLAQENLNQATGSLYDQEANYLVRLLNQFQSVEEIGGLVIRDQQGRSIFLSDVAVVSRGSKEREIINRLNGQECVELAIYKEGDANTVSVARSVQRRLEWLKEGQFFPQDLQIRTVFNQAEFIEQAVFNVLSAALLGGLLATLILYLFLRELGSTFTIGFSIPISIMATFALMYQTEITLNIMSLGGIALGVGMLVDNSIVVLESIHRSRSFSTSYREAVYRGTQEVRKAVTASTLTTIAVFLPLVFVEGIAGQLFRDQALTITYSLLASLLVALTVLPTLVAVGARGRVQEEAPGSSSPSPSQDLTGWRGRIRAFFHFLWWEVPTVLLRDLRLLVGKSARLAGFFFSPLLGRFDRLFEKVQSAYPPILNWSLRNKPLVFAVTLLLALLSGTAALRLGQELIPPLSQGEFTFQVEWPEGTPLNHTSRVMLALEEEVKASPEVGLVYSSVGGSASNQFARESNRENVAFLYIVLRDRSDKEAEGRVIQKVRERLSQYPDIRSHFSRPTLFTFKNPVQVEIYGYDMEELQGAAALLVQDLQRLEGLTDVRSSVQLGNPEIRLHFDRQQLARLGLSEAQVASILRNKIRGEVATRYREQERQLDILVRARETDRETFENLANLVIHVVRPPLRPGASADQEVAPPTVPIRLSALADLELRRGPTEVRRIGSQRAALVTANLAPGHDLGSVSQAIRQRLADLQARLPRNLSLTLGGQNQELNLSYRSLLFALALAVFLVYLVMASQFESLIHPFVILFSVPLGAIGVVFALYLTGTDLSVTVFLGGIVLAGIVVNNAIVLVDYANQLRERGLPRRQALLQAGQVRLRPIVMTTLTTVLGLFPMALPWGEGAEVRAPMAITVMGGLLFSTLLTLIFIPVMYELLDRRVRRADQEEGFPSPARWSPLPGEHS